MDGKANAWKAFGNIVAESMRIIQTSETWYFRIGTRAMKANGIAVSSAEPLGRRFLVGPSLAFESWRLQSPRLGFGAISLRQDSLQSPFSILNFASVQWVVQRTRRNSFFAMSYQLNGLSSECDTLALLRCRIRSTACPANAIRSTYCDAGFSNLVRKDDCSIDTATYDSLLYILS